MSHLYAIRDGVGNVKLGIAKSVSDRRSALQTGNASALSLVGYAFCGDDAPALEKSLHDSLARAGLHVRGEWFAPSITTTCVANAVSVGFLQEADDIARLAGHPEFWGEEWAWSARYERLLRSRGQYDNFAGDRVPAICGGDS